MRGGLTKWDAWWLCWGGDAAPGGEAADPLLMLRAVVNARFELRQHLKDPGHTYNGRLKDVLYLDLALEQTARTVMEGSVSALERTGVSNLMQGSALALESLCMSTHSNEELVLCLKEWQQAMETQKRGDDGWALRCRPPRPLGPSPAAAHVSLLGEPLRIPQKMDRMYAQGESATRVSYFPKRGDGRAGPRR